MSDFQNSSLFGKIMKNYKTLEQWHMVTHPFSLVPPPLKNIVYFFSLLIISASFHEMRWVDVSWIWNMKIDWRHQVCPLVNSSVTLWRDSTFIKHVICFRDFDLNYDLFHYWNDFCFRQTPYVLQYTLDTIIADPGSDLNNLFHFRWNTHILHCSALQKDFLRSVFGNLQ